MAGIVEPMVEPFIGPTLGAIEDIVAPIGVIHCEKKPDEFPPPSPRKFIGEIKSIAFAISHSVESSTKKLLSGPKSFTDYDHVTLAFPGVGSPGWLLDPTVGYLNTIEPESMAAFTWGRHVNVGPTNFLYNFIDELIDKATYQSGSPITGVGHSLGALFHLYFARKYPEKYDHVIGLAGPCELTLQEAHTKTNIGPAFTIMERLKFLFREDIMDSWEPQRNLEPIPGVMRSMIIASDDGVVDPLSCLLPDQQGCRNFVIKGVNHSGVLDDRDVQELVGLLRRYGNGRELDRNLSPRLVSRLTNENDVEYFEKKPSPSTGDIIRGACNFIQTSTIDVREKIYSPIRNISTKASNALSTKSTKSDDTTIPITNPWAITNRAIKPSETRPDIKIIERSPIQFA